MSELVHVKGFKELDAMLKSLPAKIEANVMRAALREGAKVIKEEVQNNLIQNKSLKSRILHDSVRVSTSLRRGIVRAMVRAQGDPYNVALWVEFGTAAHFIKVPDEARPTRKKRNGIVKMISLKTVNKMVNSGSLIIGGRFVGQSVHHPGSRAKPYMRPALSAKAHAALLAIGEGIKKRLTKRGINASGIDIA